MFTLKNKHGLTMDVLNFGGAIRSLFVPDEKGEVADIVLGFDEMRSYQNYPYIGTFVGRYANRINNAEFFLEGKHHKLSSNWKTHTLHGGEKNFSNSLWNASFLSHNEGPCLKLTHLSPDGDQGFPGELFTELVYRLTDDQKVIIEAKLTTTEDTFINVTQHTYFNLAGHDSGNIFGQNLKIYADEFTPLNTDLIPTGEQKSVINTPYDFRNYRNIKTEYDQNFVLSKKKEAELILAAEAFDPVSGRKIKVTTTEPGIQLYTANHFENIKGKNNALYQKNAGFCLETAHFPDSPNRPLFPSTLLKKGETYHTQTIWDFRFS